MSSESLIAYVNGEYVPKDQARISVFDFGFLRGDAVFDTTSAWNGRIFKLPAHLERLELSLRAARIPCPLPSLCPLPPGLLRVSLERAIDLDAVAVARQRTALAQHPEDSGRTVPGHGQVASQGPRLRQRLAHGRRLRQFQWPRPLPFRQREHDDHPFHGPDLATAATRARA